MIIWPSVFFLWKYSATLYSSGPVINGLKPSFSNSLGKYA